MLNWLFDALEGIAKSILTAILLFSVVFPLIANARIFRSKRDPYFWRRNAQIGSPLWLSGWLSGLLFVALSVANLGTPIAYELYQDVFGVGRGNLQNMSDSIWTSLVTNYGSLSSLWHVINPGNWQTFLAIWPMYWTIIFLLLLALGASLMYTRYNNTRDRSQEEYGGATFTEPYEARQQYVSVPDRGLTFKGYGGVPIMHTYNLNKEGFELFFATVRPKAVPSEFYKYKPTPAPKDTLRTIPGRYLIDGKAVNTIIVGETRSGKGETQVLATIDLIARGEADQSLVVADLKGELFTKTNELLKKHNYDVRVLNFDNLSYSMSMNLLTQALYYAKKRNYARARTKIGQLANTIFPSDDADFKNRFWTNGSSATFTGLALATLWFMREKDDWDKVTVGNVVEMLQQLATVQVTTTMDKRIVTQKGDELDEIAPNRANPAQVQTQQMNKLDLMVSVMSKKAQQKHEAGEADELLDMAISSFNQAGMGSADTKGNIYSSMFSDVDLFVTDINVRKMTSMDNFRYSSVGFPRVLEIQLPGEFGNRKVRIRFTAGRKDYEDIVIADEMGLVQYAIEPKLDDYTEFTVTFDLPDNKLYSETHPDSNIYDLKMGILAKKQYESQGLRGRKLDSYTGKPVIKGYGVLEDGITHNIQDPNIEIRVNFEYTEKRVAIFVVLPPLSKQYYQLALFFLEQLYQENYDWANRNKKKNINRIHFLLDEYGNLPKWPGMDTKLSAALGYNFAFTMVLQNLEQLETTYGKDMAGTLVANSSNFFYIKTSSTTTAEELSKRLGNRTITMRTAGRDDKNGDQTSVQTKERALLTAQELMKFRPSQMLAFRSAKNDDNSGALVDTNPLYNYGWTSMPFAFNLLRGYISDSAELSRVEVDSPHRFIDLNRFRVNYNRLLNELYIDVYGTTKKPRPAGSSKATAEEDEKQRRMNARLEAQRQKDREKNARNRIGKNGKKTGAPSDNVDSDKTNVPVPESTNSFATVAKKYETQLVPDEYVANPKVKADVNNKLVELLEEYLPTIEEYLRPSGSNMLNRAQAGYFDPFDSDKANAKRMVRALGGRYYEKLIIWLDDYLTEL
jgi:Type IV secretory pathway, VirD4 components